MTQHDCFISYKSEDRRYAELVHERLKATAFEHVWFDREELRPGARWANELERPAEGEAFAEKALRIFLEAARDRPVSPPLVGNAFLGWGACLHRRAIAGEEIRRRRVALFAEYGVEALWPEIEAGILAEVEQNSRTESR